jgi:hypothetical protein
MSTATKTTPVPLAEAIVWTENWRNSDHVLHANSFIFDADDFRDLLKEETVHHIRLYVCRRTDKETGISHEKMICVAANEWKRDILDKTQTNDTTGIYDFSHPCPPTCYDNESPLSGFPPV